MEENGSPTMGAKRTAKEAEVLSKTTSTQHPGIQALVKDKIEQGKKRTRKEKESTTERPTKRAKTKTGAPKAVKVIVKRVLETGARGRPRDLVTKGSTGGDEELAVNITWKTLPTLKSLSSGKRTSLPDQLKVTNLKPRIWASNRKELLAIIPDFTGSRCTNGLSWSMFETPILLLDDTSTCFEILQEGMDTLTLDLVTTRDFVCPSPLKVHVEELDHRLTSGSRISDEHAVVAESLANNPGSENLVKRKKRGNQTESNVMPPMPTYSSYNPITMADSVPSIATPPSTHRATKGRKAQAVPTAVTDPVPPRTSEERASLSSDAGRSQLPTVGPEESAIFKNAASTSQEDQVQARAVKDDVPATKLSFVPINDCSSFTQGSNAQPSKQTSLYQPNFRIVPEFPSDNAFAVTGFFDQIHAHGFRPDPFPSASDEFTVDEDTHKTLDPSYHLTSALEPMTERTQTGTGLAAYVQSPHQPSRGTGDGVALPFDDMGTIDNSTHSVVEAGVRQKNYLPLEVDVEVRLEVDPEVTKQLNASANPTGPTGRQFASNNAPSASSRGVKAKASPHHSPSANGDMLTSERQPPRPAVGSGKANHVAESQSNWKPVSTENDPDIVHSPVPRPVLDLPPDDDVAPNNQPTHAEQKQLEEHVPSSIPEEVQVIVDSYLSGKPLNILISNRRFQDHWSLRLPANFGYVVLGYFRILGVQERRVPLSDAGSVNPGMMTGRVQWRFRLRWAAGGEEFIMPECDKESLEYPWWSPAPTASPSPPSSPMDIDSDNEGVECELTFDTTPRYRQARLSHHNYQWRHHPLRDLYHSLVPSHLLLPYGLRQSDASFPKAWFCAVCGRMNYQVALRHRNCPSLFCKDLPACKPYAIELAYLRDPQDNLPISLPYNTYPEPLTAAQTIWEDGTRTLSCDIVDDGSVFMRHIFTRNLPAMQVEATRLLMKIQVEVELVRSIGDSTPYFKYSASGPKNHRSETTPHWKDVPLCINHAKDWIIHRSRWYGELTDDQLSINHLMLLAWVTSGKGKGPEVIRAKKKCVVFHSFGCEIVMTATALTTACAAVAVGKTERPNLDTLLPMEDIDLEEQDLGNGWVEAMEEKEEEPTEEAVSEDKEVAYKPVSKKALKRSLVITLVHGDVVVFYGDDFEYSIQRTGTSLLLIGSHQSAL
ncbi:hypothetical protein B0H34DRAFT_702579 [Crassisporium funariophilum]|nr:hypothetical protein B0H34DRAFT_702579 [Crassisporium funariophilum]